MLNSTLLKLAVQRLASKSAAVPPPGMQQPPGMDPAAGGMPPGGGMMPGGGAPPGMPPGDPAMMGGVMPPGDPAMMGGGMPPAAAPAPAPPMPMDPMAAAGGMPGQAPQKLKPEQMMQMLDFRLYNLQQGITALLNHIGVKLEPGVLVTPPGSPTPVAEAAVPGGPMDPGPPSDAAGGGQSSGGSAIGAISPIQGASPEMAQQKAAGYIDNDELTAMRYLIAAAQQ